MGRIKHIVFVLLILFCVTPVAQPALAQTQQQYESSSPAQNHFDKKKWEKAKKGIDYSGKPPEEEKPEKLETKPKTTETNWFAGDTAKIFFISLVILILAFVVIRLLGGFSFIGNRKVSATEISIRELEENLPEHDLEKYLQDALQKKDFKLAVRIYYLIVIQRLSSRKIITWKKEKTNSEYLFEASKNGVYPLFREVTLSFDFVWYGDREITETEFERLRYRFQHLLTSIKSAA